MYLDILESIRRRFSDVVAAQFGVQVGQPAIGFPPGVDLGEVSITNCFDLAKQLRQPPRRIAETVAGQMLPLDGVERISVAGPGYLNFHLDRARLAAALLQARAASAEIRFESEGGARKVLVEHTSINPNKAAHIGHLRNSVLGDTFARLLRFSGRQVEVQNYIDNTGVQVADVVVGFVDLEHKGVAEVQRLLDDPAVRFDYYCWDLYARVTQAYEADPALAARRGETLKAIEEGHGDAARMAALISTAIVKLHLQTAGRLDIRYDLLVQESEILTLNFWKYAFELLKDRGGVWFENSGKNKGCWVMKLPSGESERSAEGDEPALQAGNGSSSEEGAKDAEDVKIIVRSNGTVTYVGKDIAYHLWKFGLLGRDFGYEPFHEYPNGHIVWRTTISSQGSGIGGQESALRAQGSHVDHRETSFLASPDPRPLAPVPSFGHASAAYAVIDTRQSYLQQVVAAAFRVLGYEEQAEHLHHFAYEVVNLSLDAAKSLGIDPAAEDVDRGYVEVSGRRGLGVKADDLIDMVIEKALAEVRAREMTSDSGEQSLYARMIGVAALRYFLLKFTRRSAIAFDFKDALAFEGETGPYLQYSVVRAQNILRKAEDSGMEGLGSRSAGGQQAVSGNETVIDPSAFAPWIQSNDFWELVLLCAQLEFTVRQAVSSEEPAVLAKYAFRLAQAFNNFYHRHRVLAEADAARRRFLLSLVTLSSRTLIQALEVLGIDVPERM